MLFVWKINRVLIIIIMACWKTQTIPSCWKKAATILIYKKGDTTDPANFRPITLQPVLYKVFASIWKARMTEYLTKNNYLDRKIQKGFTSGIDGVSCHTEQLTYVMKEARRHSRSLVITLLDLRNAFGEIQHELIRESLRFHHMPACFLDIFDNIYSGSTVRIAVNDDWSKELAVNKGVLQGDPCSPLLFNLCFNSLMITLNKAELKCLGFIWGPKNATRECSWLQYADDAVIISNSVKDTQALLDIFVTWCKWAGMHIRRDKCCTFGMQKTNNKFQQILPNIFINKEVIPPVPLGDSFVYLGKQFNFEMKNSAAKIEICDKLQQLLNVASNLKVSARIKLRILKCYIYSQLSFDLRLYEFGVTWVEQNLVQMCTKQCQNLARYASEQLHCRIHGSTKEESRSRNSYSSECLFKTMAEQTLQNENKRSRRNTPSVECIEWETCRDRRDPDRIT